MHRIALLATAATYCLPPWLPDPPLAFYVGRSWLGCLFAWALWRRWNINLPTLLAVMSWESSAAICGAYFAHLAPAATGALCDKGTGLPMTFPSLALTLWACLTTIKSDQTANEPDR